jgi:DNA-binding transcriptional LysR family regulator
MSIYIMNLSRIDLNLLLVFSSIYNEKTITKAAEKLNLSQSAVSNALNRLRYTLDDDLFFRSSDMMKPTKRAEELSYPIQNALNLIEQSLSEENFSPLTSERVFKFCLPDIAAGRILPQLAEVFQKEAPKIGVVAVATSKSDLEKLKDQELDFIIASDEALRNNFKTPVGQRFDEYFNSFLIYRDRPKCVGRKGNPFFDDKGAINLDNYIEASHVHVSYDGTIDSPVNDYLNKSNKKRRIAMSVNYVSVAKEIVRTSDYLITLSGHLASFFNKSNNFIIAPLPFETEEYSVRLIWNKRSENDASHAWMMSILYKIQEKNFGKLGDESNHFYKDPNNKYNAI